MSQKLTPWIAVDFDGTVAEHEAPFDIDRAGKPIPKMVARVRQWLAEGKDVRIFTARIWPVVDALLKGTDPVLLGTLNRKITAPINAFCEEHFGQKLAITCVKDFGMVELWDDRAYGVVTNTGEQR